MKKAFTLLELIFVIVLIGVLSGIAFYMNRPNYAQQDAQYALLKLKEARYRAIGYDDYNESNCIEFTNKELSSNESPTHVIKSKNIIIKKSSDETDYLLPDNNATCFDALGRPHNRKNIELSSLIHDDLTITFKTNTHSSTILLYKQSGYAIIKCNN